jgi:hypothetical protein
LYRKYRDATGDNLREGREAGDRSLSKSVDDLIEERHNTHGNFEDTFRLSCDMFEALTGHSLQPHEFALLNIIHKIARIKCGSYHEDHWNDIEGYARLGKLLHQKTPVLRWPVKKEREEC